MSINLWLLEATTRSLRIKPLLKEELRYGGKKIDGIQISGSTYARSNCLDFNIFTFMFSLFFLLPSFKLINVAPFHQKTVTVKKEQNSRRRFEEYVSIRPVLLKLRVPVGKLWGTK